jgi:hypothetical protein
MWVSARDRIAVVCEVSTGVLPLASGVGGFAARLCRLPKYPGHLPENMAPLSRSLGGFSQRFGMIRKDKR